MHLTQLQAEHADWVHHNFPYMRPHQPLLGLAEEVGELAHAHLKYEQGIREGLDHDVVQKLKEDAVGDIVIFLASYCNSNSIDLGAVVQVTWDKVKQRDWVANPETGVAP